MKPCALIILSALACVSTMAAAQTYTTSFEGEEDPLSEGGKWQNAGWDWTKVRKNHGIAFGTQTGTNTGARQYDDSYAHLSGFPPDQEAWGQAYIAKPDSSCHQELEILLRWTSAPHRTTGYECFAQCVNNEASYVQIVRWEGPLGKFTYLADLRGTNYGLRNGDILKASIVGNVITVSINGVEKARVMDDTYNTGNPGIGLFLQADGGRGIGSNTNFGFASFAAKGHAKTKPNGQTKTSDILFTKPWHISLSRADMLAAWGRLRNLTIPGLPLDQHFKIDGPAFYVSPTGSNAADGSKDHPWQTLQFAVTQLKPGTIIYLTAGTYSGPVAIKTKATEIAPAALRAVAGDEVVVTYSEDYIQQQKSQIAQV